MRYCNNCGAPHDDNAFVCPNCGSAVDDYPISNQRRRKEAISVGGWIGRTLIPCIPLVGGIVYLIMLFIWSGDQNKEDTFRNWAKAQLIVMAVAIVLVVLIVVVFGASIADILYYM